MKFGISIHRKSVRIFMILAVVVFGGVSLKLVDTALAQGAENQSTNPDQHLVTIYDRGNEKTILTKSKTVRQALDAAEIKVFEGQDVIEPSLDTELIAEKYSINIYRARPIVISDGGNRQRITTAEQTPELIARAASTKIYPEDKIEIVSPDNLLRDGVGLVMNIERAAVVHASIYGKTSEMRTMAKTVGEFLDEKNIKLAANDTLSVDRQAPIVSGMSLAVWRNGIQTVTVEEEIDFPVEKIRDANREAGYREVKETGQKGKKNVTYEINMQNGQEVSRKEIASVVTEEPKKQVEIVGAKFKYTGGPLSEEQITALGMCESGMTATRNSGNGFYGAFQFMPSTWSKVAPAPYNSMLPHEAPLEAQKQAVQNLLSRSSIYTQFPGCAKKMAAQGIL